MFLALLFFFFSRRVSRIFTRIALLFFSFSLSPQRESYFSAALLLLHNARTDNTHTQTTRADAHTHLSLSLSPVKREKKPREREETHTVSYTHVYSGA